MHNERVRLGAGKPRPIQAEQIGVLADAREHRFTLSLMLNPQQIDDIGLGNCLIHIVSHSATHLLKHPGHQRGRTA